MRTLLLSIGVILGACSSETPRNGPDPSWIRDPARTVDNGYIVYIGTGDDSASDRAAFKAEAQAMQDLANECSFVPKGARLEDRFQKTEGNLKEAYAKVGVEFQLCEQAKKTLNPDEVRKLANAEMAAEIKRYQEGLGQQDLKEIAENEAGEEVPMGAAPPPLNNDFHYFVVREQIANEKEYVILSPPAAYAPGAPATAQYMTAVQAPTQQVAAYQVAHPEAVKSPQTWSAMQPKIRELNRQRDHRYSSPFQGEKNLRPQDKPRPKGQNRRRRGHGMPGPEEGAPNVH